MYNLEMVVLFYKMIFYLIFFYSEIFLADSQMKKSIKSVLLKSIPLLYLWNLGEIVPWGLLNIYFEIYSQINRKALKCCCEII